MRALIDKETGKQLQKLSSVVRFVDMVRPRLYQNGDDKGEQMLDKNGKPVNDNTVRAELYEDRKGGRQWLAVEAGNREEALRQLMVKAKSAPRPATTAEELAEQLAEERNHTARLERQLKQQQEGSAGKRSNISSMRGENHEPQEPEEPLAPPAPPSEQNETPVPKRGRGRPKAKAI